MRYERRTKGTKRKGEKKEKSRSNKVARWTILRDPTPYRAPTSSTRCLHAKHFVAICRRKWADSPSCRNKPFTAPFLHSAEINDREEEWREIEHHITDIKRDRAISRDKIVPNFLYI